MSHESRQQDSSREAFVGRAQSPPSRRRTHASAWGPAAALALALAAGCAPDSVAPPAGHRPAPPGATAPLSAPFDVAAAIERAQLAFRADRGGWSGGHDTYAVHATGATLAITPFLREEPSASGGAERIVAGADVTLHAASVARGRAQLASGGGATSVDRDGRLSIDRGAVVESVENRAGGVEQSWSFARRPAAAGDLTVRVALDGEEFVAGTSTGLHFRDARTGLGVRYGHGTWVDAAGVQTPVPARWDGAAIVLTVPSAVVDGAAYPAVLDPSISPEFGVDRAPPGPADGTSPALASDGHDFLLVWQSRFAIVGAWLGPDGHALPTGSFVLSTNQLAATSGLPLSNRAPSVASNGHGFLVAWIADSYTGTVDISEVRGVRVDQEHGALDAEDLVLGRAPVDTARVSSIDVGSNGRDYLVAWRYSLSQDHVLGTRVSASGALPGTTTLAVADGLGAPKVASDGTGYFVAMGRTGARVSASGALLDPSGIALPGGDVTVFNGQDYVVAWSESRGATGRDLFAARVSTSGAVRDPSGIAVSAAPNDQGSPALSYDGRDVVVGWSDARASSACDPCALDPVGCSPCACNPLCSVDLRATALYAARFTRSGLVRDPGGVAVTVPAFGARSLVMASNDAATLIGWEGPPQSAPDGPDAIYGARLTRAGEVRTLSDPVLAHATGDQRAPAVAADGDGGFLVVWQGLVNHAPAGATRDFSWDILGARVGAFGAFGAPIVVSGAAGEQHAPAVTFAAGRYLVVWQDHRGDTWDIYGARVTRAGAVRDPAGIAIAAAPDTQTDPAVAGGMVVWMNRDDQDALSVRGARVSTAGAVLDPSGLPISAAGESAGSPAIAVAGAGYRVAWARTGPSTSQVVTAALDAEGLVHGPTAMPLPSTALDVTPSVACGSGGCLVAWCRRDPSRGTFEYLGAAEDIYGARVDNAGALSAPSPIALVPPVAPASFAARFSQYRTPRVAADGDGFLVAWELRHGGGFVRPPLYDVLATRVSSSTSTSAQAFAVASDGVWSRTPVVAANPGGPAIVAYARSELGPSDSARFRVVARLLTPNASCAGGACPGASCIPGFGDCDGSAANGCEASLRADRANCGACGHACGSGETCFGAVCAPVPPPRAIAPLSTATVTSRRPTLRWALGEGSDGAQVEICPDRECTSILLIFDAAGTSGVPPVDLPSGVLFWRVFGRAGAEPGLTPSPMWEFTVGARSAPVNTSWGTTLDVNGDGYADAVVGASSVGSATGRAYVYLGGASGLSTTAATTLTGPDGAEGYFGDSVASAGDVNGDGYGDLLVGAPGASGGRAYVYLGSASGLGATPATALTNPEGTYGRFANSIASAGDVNGDGYADVVIGASYTWRTYLYLGGAAGLGGSPAATIATPDGLGGDVVASAGDVNGDGHADVVVGSVNADDHAGRAYLYLGGASGLGATPATTLSGPDGGDGQFGFAIANAGDVNGDGYSDVVAGAIALGGYTGRVYLYLGGASGLGATPATTLPGFDGGYGWFGYSIAGAGDVNGDGYGDVVIGAVGASDFAGRSYVYLGGAGGLATTPAATLTGTESNGSFGYSVAGAGDVNGDGYVDVLVGASSAANGNGRAYLYLGGASGLSLTPATTLSGPDSGPGYFGTSVASAVDVNTRSPSRRPSVPSTRPSRASTITCAAQDIPGRSAWSGLATGHSHPMRA